MDDFFIECVRQYPCLWDTTHSSYKQLDVKDAAWKEIIKKTKIENVTLAKTKWKNLRDTHREKLKKIYRTKSRQSQKKIKPWKYMTQMEFLLPYMSSTERYSNVSLEISKSLEETASAAEDSGDSDSLVKTNPKKIKTVEMVPDNENMLSIFLKEMQKNREYRTAQRDELSKVLTSSSDSLKAFFDSMYQSTKQMPECYQREIKRNLFQSVMNAEENIENTKYSYPGNFSNQAKYSSEHASTYSPEPSDSGINACIHHTNKCPHRDSNSDLRVGDAMPLNLAYISLGHGGCQERVDWKKMEEYFTELGSIAKAQDIEILN
ncbi:hypothetical protein evm_005608 [Chilo suppressalis]|nr:hypothetical protein evm_005608 [Chilo suppressalis]